MRTQRLFVNRRGPGTGAGLQVRAGELPPEPRVADDEAPLALTMGELQRLIADGVAKAMRKHLGDVPREVIDAAGRRVAVHAANDPLALPPPLMGVPSVGEFTRRVHDQIPGPLEPPRLLGDGSRSEPGAGSISDLNRQMAALGRGGEK